MATYPPYPPLAEQGREASQLGIRWEPCDDQFHLAPDYWDCGCAEAYIHRKGTMPTRASRDDARDIVEYCPVCDAEELTCPDSRLPEVVARVRGSAFYLTIIV